MLLVFRLLVSQKKKTRFKVFIKMLIFYKKYAIFKKLYIQKYIFNMIFWLFFHFFIFGGRKREK